MKNEKNCNCANEANKLAGAICAHRKGLQDKNNTAVGENEASKTLIYQYESKRGYKLCCLSMAEETHRFYRDIDNYELFDMLRSAEIIQVNVDGYSKKNAELAKMIKDGSKMLNELKDKLHDANNAACAMYNCLKSIMGFSDDKVPTEISNITATAKSLSEDGKAAAEALVTIAGIHTFSNVDELKPFSKNLVDKLTLFKKTTNDYIKKAAEDAKTAQTELTKAIDELNTEEFKFFEGDSVSNGLSATLDFICNGQCESISVVDDICQELTEGGSSNGEGTTQKSKGHLSSEKDSY